MAADFYHAFIREAFVKPIRSVLIVDDDYPTFDEVLDAQYELDNEQTTGNRKAWRDTPEQFRAVINRFRRHDPPLLIDVHDGTNVASHTEQAMASHLHQSDLLVLDFELDKSKGGDGTRAIEILRCLISNPHFNLVVIYTKEILDVVFNDVLWGLIGPSSDRLSTDDSNRAIELLQTGEDNVEGFENRISVSVGGEQYFYSRLHKKSYTRTMARGYQPYSAFKQLCDSVNIGGADRRLVLKHLFEKLERGKIEAKTKTESVGELSWSSGSVRWIKSDSLFVAFSEKTINDDLLSELQAALNDWCPRPSRLFLTRLRADMDEYGVAAQSQALDNNLALVYWYDRLLRATDDQDRRWRVAESVARQSEQLMGAVLPRVEEFALRLINAENDGRDVAQICRDHFQEDLENDRVRKCAAIEHNAFVCSKEPEGWHLFTGHIFVMCDEHWLCLSPACDMVPSQLSPWRIETLGDRLPFIAVKLQEMADGRMPESVHSNRYIFLRIDGKVKVFCINNPSRLAEGSSPQWYVLYAEKRGKFSKNALRFTVLRTEQGKTRLIAKRHEAKVVSQLRYEYALNLIQKLGVSLTRIGLDFAGA